LDLHFPARTRTQYAEGATGIEIPIELDVGHRCVRLAAKIDTGASYCIFQREYAEQLGLDVEAGERMAIGTATGSFEAFGHTVLIKSCGIELESTVYFAALENFPRNVLGLSGWLNRIRFGLIEHECAVYLMPGPAEQ